MAVLAELLAGLGLLFVGLSRLSSHLQHATGWRVRHLLRTATGAPLLGLLCGTLAGAATQSSNAVAVICGNLVRGGVLRTRDAIPVVAGGSVGTAALVFVAAIDFRLLVLFAVAVVGFAIHLRLDQRPGWRDWVGVALGLALALLGLVFIKQAPHDLDAGVVARWLGPGLAPVIGFALGAAAATLSQSSSAPTILVLALMQSQMLDLSTAFPMVVGANLGSGLSTLLAAGGLEGTGRQLCYVHVLVKAVGCALVTALWGAVHLAGGDPAQLLLASGGGSVALAVSVLFLALQLAGALPASLARGLTERIAIRFSPPTLEDGASRPHYIHERALEAPASALDLSQREIGRLITLLPTLLPDLDQSDAASPGERLAMWRGAGAVVRDVDLFLVALIGRAPGREELATALRQQTLVEMIRALQDTLHDFSEAVESFDQVPTLGFNLSESLRTLVLALADADGDDDLALLAELTGDRSELLNRIRRSLLGSAPDGSFGGAEETRRLLLATSLFERAVWLMHRIVVALRPAENDDNRREIPAGAERNEVHAH